MDTCIANLQTSNGQKPQISFHDLESSTRPGSSRIQGYHHQTTAGHKNNDGHYAKAVTKGNKLASRAAQLLSRGTREAALEMTGNGLVGGSPCDGHARMAEGITWFEKVNYSNPVTQTTASNYLHFSSPTATIAPDTTDLHDVTIVTGMCLFSSKILQSSLPPGGGIDLDKLTCAGPTLYEAEYMARSAPVLADFASLLDGAPVAERNHPRRLSITIDVPSFHYYQSVDSRVQEKTCTFSEALQWIETVKERHNQISTVFKEYISTELSRRNLKSLHWHIDVAPSTDIVYLGLTQSLNKGLLPSLKPVLQSLSDNDSTWERFLQLIPQKEWPQDFRSLGYLFYVFQVLRPALLQDPPSSSSSSDTTATASNTPTADAVHHAKGNQAKGEKASPSRLPQLVIGIDDGVERRIYSRAQKALKKMRAQPTSENFHLLEVYLCRRVFINNNELGSNLYLDDASPQLSLATEEGSPEMTLTVFDVIQRLYGSSTAATLEYLFMSVGLRN